MMVVANSSEPARKRRMLFRRLLRFTCFGLACYGAVHLAGVVAAANSAWPLQPARFTPKPLTRSQQPLVSALTRLLDEDGVQQPARWASAIVCSSPTQDLGYLALVAAQIRRESHFLAPDLEWLYQRVVPELVHSLGVADPIHTIGPMQVQSFRLHDHFEQALGTSLNKQNVRELSLGIETGVAACVAVLDEIVVRYLPDRHLSGWVFAPGPDGLQQSAAVLASDFLNPTAAVRQEALRQKLLSDLTGEPLALDGVLGSQTTALLASHPDWQTPEALHQAWQQRFGVAPPEAIPPRISHDPRLAFVLADFHSGPFASRIAALQALTNQLFTVNLQCDGKWGPKTKAQMSRLIGAAVADADRRAAFELLLASGHKRHWLQGQLLQMARDLHQHRTGRTAPAALVPDFWFDSPTQTIKGIGRISVAGYVAGSVRFYEDYLQRLCVYTGIEPPGQQVGRLQMQRLQKPH